MAWQDRPYYRDRSDSAGNPLMWFLTGSVHLFTVFGIRVRAHAALIVFIALVLLFGGGMSPEMRIQSMTVLFGVILLHEFGHCFAARWTGGSAEEIIMTPLGGLALAMARKKPWPTFVTVAGGPLVNVLICLVCLGGIYLLKGSARFLPTGMPIPRSGWLTLYNWLFWIYGMSLGLLIFNLIPAYPLDGGQLLQSILWKPLGYYRSMLITMNVGLVLSVLMFMWGIASWGSLVGGLFLMLIALNCFQTCYQMRAMLRAEGPWGFQEEDSTGVDYSQSLYDKVEDKRSRKTSQRAARKAEKIARQEVAEQARIDVILDKVSAHGMHSLTWLEKRALHKATEAQKKRDAQRGGRRRGL